MSQGISASRVYSFLDWFDIHNKAHLSGLGEYIKGGSFPKHFIPADVFFPEKWEDSILTRIAIAWIDTKVSVTKRDYVVEEYPKEFGGMERKYRALDHGDA